MTEPQRPKVGIGVLILKDGKVLLAQRKNAHGEGEWAFPGGHLEFGESFAECARRETREEAGIEIENIQFQMLANLIKYAGKQYVHIGVTADWKSGEPQNLEPDKAGEWGWYSPYDLPEPLFETARTAIESLTNKRNYYDLEEEENVIS